MGAISFPTIDTEIMLNLKVEALDEGGFVATSADLPGLVVQGRTRTEVIELAQANARILVEVYLSEKLPLPRLLRRAFKRKARTFNLPLPVTVPEPA
jgi:antitoxin HicB